MASPSPSAATAAVATPAAPAPAPHRGLINSPDTQVTDAIEGFLLTHPHTTKLDGGKEIKVVLRSSWRSQTTNCVALLSGGGEGHAPAHAGFVGEGMLTAAVSGEVFASPSVKAILAAIRAVARSDAGLLGGGGQDAAAAAPSPGVLMIVKQYTGDKLNFGIALSRAVLEGIPCAMVVVGDDVTLPRSKGVTGRRGIAGTVLVHKVAGYAAAQGKSLKDITRLAEQAASSLVSIGMASSICHVPGVAPDPSRLAPGSGTYELGLGIHGEPGLESRPLEPARDIVKRMLDALLSRDPERDYLWRCSEKDAPRPHVPNTQIVLLVNNLGGATANELNVFLSESVQQLQARGFVIRRVLSGTVMSALDMVGISLTLFRLSGVEEEAAWQLEALDAPTEAPGWPRTYAKEPHWPLSVAVPADPSAATAAASAVSASAADSTTDPSAASSSVVNIPLLRCLADTILSNADALNSLDARCGDGDCGLTLSLGAKSLLRLIDEGVLSSSARSLSQLLGTLASNIGDSMGGSSGAVLQILLTAAAAKAQADERAAVVDSSSAAPSSASSSSSSSSSSLQIAHRLCAALLVGCESVTRFGGAREGDRTMLDALGPAVRACAGALDQPETTTLAQAISAGAMEARRGADSTKHMAAKAGRANYVTDAAALSEADPGAEAVALLWEAAAKQLASV